MSPEPARRVLVAGGTGYLGGFVLEAFKRRGDFVRALARRPEKLASCPTPPDEVVSAEVTRPSSLEGVCAGIDVVFSSVGITRQKGRATWKDVDFQGNVNLLREAQRAGVQTFIYVSVFGAGELLHLDIVKAHEDFVAALRESGLDYRVIRPTGYFSDMGAFYDMARKGRVFLFGSGHHRINPIHGADLAQFCVDALDSAERELDVGGPEVLSYQDIARLALKVQARPIRISTMPLWLVRALVWLTTRFNRHSGGVLAFVTTMCTREVVAPNRVGSRTLADHYRALAAPKPDAAAR